MATIRFDLSEDLKAGLEGRVREGAYANVDAYLSDLIRADLEQDETWEMTPELATLLKEGEESGEDPRSIAEIVAEGRKRWGAQG